MNRNIVAASQWKLKQGFRFWVNNVYECSQHQGWSVEPPCYVWVLRPASFQSLQLAEPVRISHPERGADPSHLCWPGRNESVTHACSAGWVYWYSPELQRSKAQKTGIQVVKYSGVWSCAEGTASEESGKESCVFEPAIEGSIDDGSTTQHGSFHCTQFNRPKRMES